MTPTEQSTLTRWVATDDLVGSKIACERYGIDRSTLVRRIAAGAITPLKQLEGSNGAFVFDVNDLPAAKS